MHWGCRRRSSSYRGNLTKFFPSLWPSLPQTHTTGIRYSKPGAITHHWFSRAAVFFCQHCHSMKVRTRNSETEGGKIKGKVCRRKERLFNCSVNPVFLSAQLQACSEDGRGIGTAGTGEQLWFPSGYHIVADRFFRPKSPPLVVREGKWEARCAFFHFRCYCSKPLPLPVSVRYQREGNYLIVGWVGWGVSWWELVELRHKASHGTH